MRFKVLYGQDGSLKRAFLHDEDVARVFARFARNQWWGLKLLWVVSTETGRVRIHEPCDIT